jgi:hypothetical protein
MHCSSRNYDRLTIDQILVKIRWGFRTTTFTGLTGLDG